MTKIKLAALAMLLAFIGCTKQSPVIIPKEKPQPVMLTQGTTVYSKYQIWRDSVDKALLKSLSIVGCCSPTIDVAESILDPSYTPRPTDQCGAGNYIARGIRSGTMGSSFTMVFTQSVDDITNASLWLGGASIGWSWKTETTMYGTGFSGTTYGTATYVYGFFNYTRSYALHWWVTPSSCMLHYYWSAL